MGGGFGAKGAAGDYTLIAAELAKRTGRPVHCRLDRREENVNSGNRNATIQKLRLGARADGTLTALDGEYECRSAGTAGSAPTAGPMQMLYACENVRTVERGVQAEHASDGRVPRARLRRGHVRARVRCSTSSPRSSTSTRSSSGAATTPTTIRWTSARSRPRS